MEKRRPLGDITNLSLPLTGSGDFTSCSSPNVNVQPRTESPPPASGGKKKQGSKLEFPDEKKKDDFIITKSDQIETNSDISSSSKVVQLEFQLFVTKKPIIASRLMRNSSRNLPTSMFPVWRGLRSAQRKEG